MIANSSLLGRARQISERLALGQGTGDEEYERWLKDEKSKHPRGAARWLSGDVRIQSRTETAMRSQRRDRGISHEAEYGGEGMIEFDDDEGGRGGEACSAISDGERDEDDVDNDDEAMRTSRGGDNRWAESSEGQRRDAVASCEIEGTASTPVALPPDSASANATPHSGSSRSSESDEGQHHDDGDNPRGYPHHTGLSPMIDRQRARLEKAKAVQRALSDFLFSALETRTTATTRRQCERSLWEVAALSRAVCAWRMMVRAMAVMRAAVRKGRGFEDQQQQLLLQKRRQLGMSSQEVPASSVLKSSEREQHKAAGRGVKSTYGGGRRSAQLNVPGRDVARQGTQHDPRVGGTECSVARVTDDPTAVSASVRHAVDQRPKGAVTKGVSSSPTRGKDSGPYVRDDEERLRWEAEPQGKGSNRCSIKSPKEMMAVHSPPLGRVMSPPSQRSPVREGFRGASRQVGGGRVGGVVGFDPGVHGEGGGGGGEGGGGGGRERAGGGARIVGRKRGAEGGGGTSSSLSTQTSGAGAAVCECHGSGCAPGFFKQLSVLRETGLLTPAQADAVRRLAIKSDAKIQSIYSEYSFWSPGSRV